MLARPDELEEQLERHAAGLRHLGFRRTAATHRDHHRREAAARRDPRHLAGDGGLAGPLAGAEDREGRGPERGREPLRRVEPEVRTHVGHAARERLGGNGHPLAIPEHGLVRQVQHQVGRELVDRGRDGRRTVLARAAERHAQVRQVARRRASRSRLTKHGGDHLVASRARDLDPPSRDRRVVLAVDEREGAHRGGTSSDRFSGSGVVCGRVLERLFARVPLAAGTNAASRCGSASNGKRRTIRTSAPSNSSTL